MDNEVVSSSKMAFMYSVLISNSSKQQWAYRLYIRKMVGESFWLLSSQSFLLLPPLYTNKAQFADIAEIFIDCFTENTLLVGILVREEQLQ